MKKYKINQENNTMHSKTRTQNTTTLPNGYKMTELGPLPKEWEVVKLGEVVNNLVSGDWGKSDKRNDNFVQCYVIRGTDFKKCENKKIEDIPIRYILRNSIEKRKLKSGDILIELSGGGPGQPTGRIFFVTNDFIRKVGENVIFSNFVKKIEVKESLIYPDFFYRYWQYLYQMGRTLVYEKRTTGIRNFKYNDFLKQENILLPPLSEQRKIAAILSTVQKTIETEGKLIERNNELKKSMMHKLFTEGTKGEKQKMTEIGPIPQSWEVVKLGEVYSIQQGKQVSKKNRIGDRQKYFLRTANVLWGHIDITTLDLMHFTLEEEKKYKLEAGDLLVCEGGAIGRTAIWENNIDNCYYQNHLHRLRVKVNNIFPKFHLYWFWYAFEFANIYFGQGNTTTIPNLSSSRLSLLKIPTPSFLEQQAIADILITIDKKIEYHTNKKQKLEEFFRTLLHELMTAKKRVNKINLDFLKMEE